MQICNSENAADVLWSIVSPLAAEIPVYKEIMSEDENSTPESYLLIRSDITNGGRIYGDGKALLRRSNCDITLVSKSKGDVSTDIHNVNKAKVEALLRAADAEYTGYNLGYNDVQKISQYSWSVTFIYG